MNTTKFTGSVMSMKEVAKFDALLEDRHKLRSLNKRLLYFVIKDTENVSYEETVKNLKASLSWEIQHPDYMASIGEMQALEHDRLIIQSL